MTTSLSRSEKLRKLAQSQKKIGALLPLTSAQQRFWFIEQLESSSGVNNIFKALVINELLDVELLQQAMNKLLERHTGLNSRFISTRHGPKQYSLPVAGKQIKLVHVSHLVEAKKLASEDARQQFQLTTQAPYRITLYLAPNHQYLLTLCIHHIVADGYAVMLLLSELQTLYKIEQGLQISPLPLSAIDMKQYIQTQHLPDPERMQKFWLKKLEDCEHTLCLSLQPNDINKSEGQYYYFSLPATLSATLRVFCEEHQLTPFNLLLACFNILLSKLSGQSNFIIGTPVLNRDDPSLKYFVATVANTLLIPAAIDSQQSVSNYIQRLRESFYQCLAHQQLSYDQILNLVQPQRDIHRNPLFQVMFSYNALQSISEVSSWQSCAINRHYAKLDLTLEMTCQGDNFQGYFEYNTSLFSEQDIDRYTQLFTDLLQMIVCTPHIPVAKLTLSSLEDQKKLLSHQPLQHSDEDIVSLLAERAKIQPEAIALTVAHTGQQICYGQLLKLIQHYCALLQHAGITSTDVVAINCRQRLHSIIGIWSVLASGASFVVLDPDEVSSRKFILNDSGAAIVMGEQSDIDDIVISSQPASWQKADFMPVKPLQPAYIVYTSGTTGTPKGVVIPRQALANHARAACHYFQLENKRITLQSSALSFDLALEEVFPSLISGCNVILPEISVLTYSELYQVVTDYQIEHLSLSTAYWQGWVNALLQAQQPLPASVRQIVVGTEQLTGMAVKNWFTLLQNRAVALLNAYGPSETTITCSIHTVQREDENAMHVPIGKATFPNQLYILDNELSAVPCNVTGQLCIAGDNLALKYHNHPALTESRFIYLPDGTRLYASGDRAYYRPDGNICFAGRDDQQIKLRGYRIELEGIRQQLLQLPCISDCFIRIHRTDEHAQLIAYLVSTTLSEAKNLAKEYLEQRLPDYMIPQHFISIKQLPLTARGKVDISQLPSPEYKAEDTSLVSSEDLLENTLLEIWQQLLPDFPSDVSRNFFTAGGHSLLALTMLARIKDTLNIEITLRQLFEYPTIIGLARQIRQGKPGNFDIPDLRQVGQNSFPLTYSQQQMWVLHQLDNSRCAYNMPMLLLFNGPLNTTCLTEVLSRICQNQEIFRTTFKEKDGELVQCVALDSPLQLETQDISQQPETLSHLFSLQVATPFDLTNVPGYRFILYYIGENQHALGIIVHHINADGSSFQLLLREIIHGYKCLISKLSWHANLPLVQVADLALWQRHPDHQPIQQSHLNYWYHQLKTVSHFLHLATDYPRPATPSFVGARCRFTVPAEVLTGLKKQAEQHGVSLYMVSFAAYAQLLHEFSRQDNFVIGIPVSGRDLPQTSNIIGLLLNTLPIPVTFTDKTTGQDLLEQVKQQILTGFDHQQFQLPQLLQKLEIERSHSHNPLFQVLFNFNYAGAQNEHDVNENLTVSLAKEEGQTARFDLNVSMTLNGDVLSGFIEFSKDLFMPETVQLMVNRFQQLFSQFSINLSTELADFEGEYQTEFLLTQPKAAEPSSSEPSHPTLSCWFRTIAACEKEKCALVAKDRTLTYQQLLDESEKLAAQLLFMGVKPGDLLAVCLPRNSYLLVTLLAIFRCNAAYLPLDPSYPSERVNFIVNDAKVHAVICDDSMPVEALFPGIEVWPFSRLRQADTIDLPEIFYAPSQLAYCIYTSGSTGTPKGVEITQQSLLNFLNAMAIKPGICATDKLLAVTPISFDISILELFLPLVSGATLVLLSDQDNRDGERIAQQLHLHNITFMQATPTSWRLLTESSWAGKSDLKMLCGGEALPRVLAERLLTKGDQLWNMYGPTEATVWISSERITSETLNPITTGLPISNNKLYVMNPRGELAAPGSKGELYIAGENLARGYRGRSELTEERFITKTWKTGCEERLYRSGDLVKQLADGRLLFLNRLDEQIKLNGYRIELAEIEATAEKHPRVSSCAVVVRKAENGESLLVAFFTASQLITENELTVHVSQLLPSFMVPAVWQQLVSLPVTPSGKVDKNKLRQLELTQQPHQALTTATEKKVADIWQQLLGTDITSRTSNFFRLGGNSVLAMKLLALLRTHFGSHLSLALGELFLHQQLDQLANYIDELQLMSVDEDELLALMTEITG